VIEVERRGVEKKSHAPKRKEERKEKEENCRKEDCCGTPHKTAP
jgi:hypothetical protein